MAQVGQPAVAREGYGGSLLVNGKEYPLDFELVRKGNSVGGVGRVLIDDTRAITGPLAGTDNGSTHRLTLDLRPDFPVITLSGSNDGTGYTGAVDDDGAQPAARVSPQQAPPIELDNGTYQAQKTLANATDTPFGGEYTVTLDDGTVIQLEGTQALPNDPNLPDLDTTNVVTAYVNDNGDVEPNDAGGGSYIAGRLSLRLNPFDSGKYPFIACFLSGTLQSGRYTAINLIGTTPVKQGRYTMQAGF